MNNKTLSIVSYITLIGWLIAYFSGKENADSLLKYHLKQSFGLMIVSVIFNLALTVLINVIPALSILSFVGLVFLVLLIIGIINAANEVQKPLPILGKMFENRFDFIG
ncbi:DUF4870 domain-containing protein [Sphingobacterium sp. SRCM116780]|uniref:DUF4870 domain-containing protein n=1 Tax=Sphingobacterium sp. SRCM116780 TaxID=2907623 RepID=UPI001F2ED208|nr:DUF4870 domain-containing protein [Sphingobacterium sp. SRCM116780]UIR54479.1 DUF4870 domain-containing protein [Sphingobacterium sp. SRCM116780]